MLETLYPDIGRRVDRSELDGSYYIGADGKSYDSFKVLQDANRAFGAEQRAYYVRNRTMDPMNYFIGADGIEYGSSQSLVEANRSFRESLRRTARIERELRNAALTR
ncbi:MAG: hypothetical protein A2171_01035 [Candidatus Levybacteria bacterium RBG_13_35_9]|nr:MAG: hypothetical protein A2171_01035 [Candidatus Levybacteria bacterium RBG_13_35_9]